MTDTCPVVTDGYVCSNPNCESDEKNNATLACPNCQKLPLQNAYFCSQTCFKAAWSEHKKIHKLGKQLQAAQAAKLLEERKGQEIPPELRQTLPDWARNYRFSGTLRPAQQSPRRSIPSHIPRPDYATHPSGISHSEQSDKTSGKSIKSYSGEELERVKHACKMGREVLDLAGKALRVGVTCDEIDRVVHEACIERSCYPSPLNYYQFPKSVCTSVNEVICHGIPDYYEVKDGDIVNIDVTTYVGGCHGDLNETFMVGNVDAEGQKLVACAFECLQSALAQCKPGTLYRDLGNKITKVAKSHNCSVVKTYCGHGIGSLFHTSPNVPHYAKNKAKGVMAPGHVFTVEPMINLGSWEDITWDDNWTAVTGDGSRSAQFEHTVVITETGCDILTARDDEPVMVWDASKNQR
ncbi:hypothetical protein TrLO_g3461 [Triparma laevis f. longispina]|uniref:Methionine aminopeptidase n=1 Tax=Triparma laevis f. longispina TaxID=1714387 RepID=A0A9W7DRY8_9STRA|nr:hypothetical protein TrLO_g3461 [Triparma laevis f. longispina]